MQYIVIGFSEIFKTKKGHTGRMVSVGYERKGYVGYKVVEVYCDADLIDGDLTEGAVVQVSFGYNSTFCNGIKVL